MDKQANTPRVVPLGRKDLPAATTALVRAFSNDPVVRYIFAPSALSYRESVAGLYHFACEVRLLLDWPLLGSVDEDDQLQGVAGIMLPEERPWPPSLAAIYEEFKARIGDESARRFETYAQLADAHRPPLPHHQLGMIGVDPRAQGQGHASALLHALHDLAQSHPTSTGVWLDTENPRNVPIYEHFGYRIIAQETLAAVTIWGMFRARD